MGEKVTVQSTYFDLSNTDEWLEKDLASTTDVASEEVFGRMYENVRQIIENYEKHDKYLVLGDVQSGKTTTLIYLIKKLIEEEKCEAVIYLTGTKNNVLDQNEERFRAAFTSDRFRLSSTRSADTKKVMARVVKTNNDGFVPILTTLKNPGRLREVYEELVSSGIRKVLIIDDECDDWSLAEKTSEHLDNLLSGLKSKLIAISATPFDNLCLNNFFDHFTVLAPPSNYYGYKQFKSKYVLINEDEIDIVYLPLLSWALSIKEGALIDSMILYNVFSQNAKQNKLRDDLIRATNLLKRKEYVKAIADKCLLNLENADVNWISRFFQNISSDNIVLSNYKNDSPLPKNGHIVIVGGNLLSRGITYENLIAEVMLNAPREKLNAGVLLQRARWFGYRAKNWQLIKVFVSNKIFDALLEVEKLMEWTKKYHINDNDYETQFESMRYKWIKLRKKDQKKQAKSRK